MDSMGNNSSFVVDTWDYKSFKKTTITRSDAGLAICNPNGYIDSQPTHPGTVYNQWTSSTIRDNNEVWKMKQ